MRKKLTLDCQAIYQIEVQGYLEKHWSDWFDGMTIVPQANLQGKSVTRLTGVVVDQAALHGMLLKLYNLGMPLLTVKCLEQENKESSK